MASDGNSCPCDACDKARFVIDRSLQVLYLYNWLLDAYVVDFFQENLWAKLPLSWQRTLEDVSPDDLGSWILREEKSTRLMWPLSLLAFRKIIEVLQIDRNHNGYTQFKCSRNATPNESSDKSHDTSIRNTSSNVNICSKNKDLHNAFLKHVKVKKHYEVENIAEILSSYSAVHNCKRIIDVGAGIGHLSRMLAFKYGLRVTRIEQDKSLLERARILDEEVYSTIYRHVTNTSVQIPTDLLIRLDNSNAGKEFLENLISVSHVNSKESTNNDEFGIIGLHPCGDLAPTLLHLYKDCDKAKFICIVGCCYMKLTRSKNTDNKTGYPISRYVLSRENHDFSYNALEVACHALEKHCDKLREGEYSDLKVHAYRAALECLLVKANVNRHCQVRSIKVKNNLSFQQYCKLATKDMETLTSLKDLDFENPSILHLLNKWKNVLVFGTLRFMLAPLVETVVLLDRFLFLSDNNLKPSLKAEFNARISPRNFILASSK